MTYVHIKHIATREIFDSQGKPTVEVEVSGGGHRARAAAPSGKSTGVAGVFLTHRFPITRFARVLRVIKCGMTGALLAVSVYCIYVGM